MKLPLPLWWHLLVEVDEASVNENHVFYSSVDPCEAQRNFRLRGLDGLRAVAVLAVLIYHLWPTALPGGMIGVDIFFVISGYLITALLLREGAFTGKMNIVQFWVRRLRRLIPAIIVVVAVTGALAFLVGGDVLVGLGRQVTGAFTFSSNWLFIAHGNDYFAQTTPELLTNFWSLAVEEQFYIFWPIVLVFVFMFVSKWSQRAMVPATLIILSLLIATILHWSGANASRIYYGTDTHLFGIMTGVLLALLIPWSMYPPADSRLYQHIGWGEGILGLVRGLLGWICLIAIVPLALYLTDRGSFFMPWGLFAASLLAVGVIQGLLADVHNVLGRMLRAVLSFAPLVWLGKRSYGIYLWHWPLAVLAHYVFGAQHGPVISAVVLVLTLLIAGLSYMYIEDPVRKLGFRGALSAWAKAIAGPHRAPALACALLLALCGAATAGAIATAPQLTEAEAVIAQGQNAEQSQHHTAPSAQPSAGSSASAEADGVQPGSVSIVGDSVTLAAMDALQNKIPQADIDAQVSRNISEGLPLIEDDATQGHLGQVVVISLSTNTQITMSEIDELIKAIAPHQERKIVLVTGVGPANLSWVAESNKVIAQAAQKYPQTISVADWAAAQQGHPEYLVSDGVHPQAKGQQVYAQTIAQAVDAAQKSLRAEGKLSDDAQGSASAEPTPAPSPATSKAW